MLLFEEHKKNIERRESENQMPQVVYMYPPPQYYPYPNQNQYYPMPPYQYPHHQPEGRMAENYQAIIE